MAKSKSADPVTQARKEQKKRDKAKNAKARKAAREAPKKAEGASTSAGPVIIPGQDGRSMAMGGKGKNGRDPRRSVYYDPVFNPYGAPPPGMEYRERDPTPEVESEDSSDDSDEESDGIELPEGPKPESESEDEIPMPEGPPPGQVAVPLLVRPSIAQPAGPPIMPPGFPVPHGGHLPFPPQQPAMLAGPPQFHPRMALPHLDPMTGAPQQPFQAYRGGPQQSMPPARVAPPKPSQEAIEAARKAATISAEPQLRDLRKEVTTFVPTAIKRKRTAQAATAVGIVGRINAAPASPSPEPAGDDESEAYEAAPQVARPSLLGAVRDAIGPEHKRPRRGDTDLERFEAGMADLA